MIIATWNLESLNPLSIDREARFRTAIDKVGADVWVLTETWINFSPGGNYRLVAQTARAEDLALDGRPSDRRWVAIWSRLVARQLEVLNDPERMACIRVEIPTHRDVVVVGTVLPWRKDKRHGQKKGVAAEFRDMIQAQSSEWRQLWDGTGSTGFCVAGDFNQEMIPRHHTGTSIGQQALTNALNKKGSELTCLTHDLKVVYPRTKIRDPLPVIDHICVGGGLKLRPEKKVETWDVPAGRNSSLGITDHVGVFADLV